MRQLATKYCCWEVVVGHWKCVLSHLLPFPPLWFPCRLSLTDLERTYSSRLQYCWEMNTLTACECTVFALGAAFAQLALAAAWQQGWHWLDVTGRGFGEFVCYTWFTCFWFHFYTEVRNCLVACLMVRSVCSCDPLANPDYGLSLGICGGLWGDR